MYVQGTWSPSYSTPGLLSKSGVCCRYRYPPVDVLHRNPLFNRDSLSLGECHSATGMILAEYRHLQGFRLTFSDTSGSPLAVCWFLGRVVNFPELVDLYHRRNLLQKDCHPWGGAYSCIPDGSQMQHKRHAPTG